MPYVKVYIKDTNIKELQVTRNVVALVSFSALDFKTVIKDRLKMSCAALKVCRGIRHAKNITAIAPRQAIGLNEPLRTFLHVDRAAHALRLNTYDILHTQTRLKIVLGRYLGGGGRELCDV